MSDGIGLRPTWRAAPAASHRAGASVGEIRADSARGRAERRAQAKDSASAGSADPGDRVQSLETDSDLLLATVGNRGEGDSSSDAQDGRHEGSGNAAPPETDRLDPRLSHVAETIAMVCRQEPSQCIWSARIPLDAELLPDTVLHLAYSPLLLALRFETSDCQVRSLLQGQLPALEAAVRAWMPEGAEVFASL